ncbi:MAG TPA: MarR family winged helix-turn-helix transcriptional regulator [Polyangiaceae bacterium]
MIDRAASAPPVGPLFLVSQVGAQAMRLFAARLAKVGLKPQHAGILRILAHDEGLSQRALSTTLGAFASQVVLLLDDLEAQKLLERRATPEDRRSHRLFLTTSGRKRATAIAEWTKEIERSFFGALSRSELAKLESMLRDLVAAQALTPSVHPAYRNLERRRPPKKKGISR